MSSPASPSPVDLFAAGLAEGWAAEPEQTVSEWAQAHRILVGTSSAEPGAWRNSRTPYLVEVMDQLSASNPARRVALMAGTQIGKTEAGNNWLGYIIHRAPGPILFVEPTVDLAKAESKQRVGPMIDATPELSARVSDARERDSGNTILVKEFPGGVLALTGANSAVGLRRMPARYLFLDEIDAYPGDVEGEGDPIALAERRTTNFPKRKLFLVSTPTIKGVSRIEREFLASDQRRYFVPCPLCGAMDWIRWENIRWDEGQPWTARLACVACGGQIEEWHKTEMLSKGEWRPTSESDGRTIGFHLSALYSPLGWKSWGECAEEFLLSKEDPFLLKTWVNTVLGETWEERGDSVDPAAIAARLERYPAEVPAGVGVLVAAVDVQGDRLEAQVVGYGAGEESWLIAFSEFHGDPITDAPWFDLDRFLLREFEHESGRKLRVECAAIDSGGHHTEQVYRFARPRLARRVFAVKGGSERGKPLVSRPSEHNRYRAKLFTLCVDTGKEIALSRLRIQSPGPGFAHFPEWIDAEYLAQLAAEKAVRKYHKGRGAVREWVKLRERNEALDLTVYSLAALHILGPIFVRSLPERAAALARPADESEATQAEGQERPRPKRSRGGWVDSWRS